MHQSPAPQTAVSQADLANNPLQLDDLLPKLNINPLGRGIKTVIEKTLGLSDLAKGYRQLQTNGDPENFVQEAFNLLDIKYQLVSNNLDNIPATGATIVVANHPYGAVDGMAMIDLLLKRRKDIKVMANGILKRVPEISDIVLSVNPYGHNDATKQNSKAMRECLRWLENDGLVFMFPAGDVSSFKFKKLSISDTDWDSKVARLAIKTGASVIPSHIDGRNSAAFYLAGAIHPALKTLMLPRQILNKRGRTIDIRIGQSISAKQLQKINSPRETANILKSRAYLLTHHFKPQNNTTPAHLASEDIAAPVAADLLEAEITRLSASSLLLETGDMQVFVAGSKQIPNILQEIGRLRETSFRAIGEGSGKSVDIDQFDMHYRQMFIWNTETREIVGGYRLGLTDDILLHKGIKGIYSHTLFAINPDFFNSLAPAIDLGRSFIRPEYQKSFSPLMLLWKGILRFVYLNPKYCILFGPVSISNDYTSISQNLLIQFLKNRYGKSRPGKLIRPRNPYKPDKKSSINLTCLQSMSMTDISTLISSLEEDGKGVPVLVRQYLKLGGEILKFNRDPAFGDCIDGFLRMDLRQANEKNLGKFMGKPELKDYLNYHTISSNNRAV